MSNWGMSNRVAATPEQAIELLAQAAARGAPYDIAIIDLGLPGMDALELARAIRARADIAKVRLVMLTRRQVDIKNARDAGIDACLAKPVRQTMLYECLVNVMAGQPQEAAAAPAVSRSPRARRRPTCAATSCWWKTTSSTSRWRSASCRSRATT